MRATLYILGGRSVGRSFEVEDSAVIGREPSCQVRLGDKSISRRHARIMWDGFRWRVEDLDSRNGVHMDKRRVRESNLADGDEFMLGEVPVRLRIEAEATPVEEPDFEFEDDFLAGQATQPKPPEEAQSPLQREELGEEIVLEEEIQLEEDIQLGSPEDLDEAPGLELHRRPGGSQATSPGPVRLLEAPASRLRKDLDPRAKLLADSSKRGFLGGDLSQQPRWVLGLLFLVLACFMAAIAYLVFTSVQSFQT